MPRFLSVCLNPTFQRTIRLEQLDHGEVNRASEARLDVSGKGVNVSRVLQQLGASVKHLTHTGPGKEEFLRLCETEQLEITGPESDSPIRTCITILDSGKNSTTEIIEPTKSVDTDTVKAVRLAFTREIADSDWIILSGSKAPGYPDTLFADFCREASEKMIPVLIDYRGDELIASLPFHPSVVKINLVEFTRTFLSDLKVSEADDTSALPQVKKKLTELSLEGINYVITRGAREIILAEKGSIDTVTPPRVTPVNTIGSGDAVAAGIAFSLSKGTSLKEAVIEGTRCGSANAKLLKPGSIY